MIRNVLITGITGFAGSHLADYIVSKHPSVRVWGTRRYRTKMENLSKETQEKVQFAMVPDVDYTDAAAVQCLINDVQPDRIFHLAAESWVPASWKNPSMVFNNNVQSQINIFEAVLKEPTGTLLDNCRIQVAGSSEEYGRVFAQECPITEQQPFRPLSPYAVSKVAQDLLGYQYHKTYGLYVVRTRAFNHTGPRRGDVFICSSFAKQIAEIEVGKQSLHGGIAVGNLEAIRDFTDVRDMVRAYWLALEHCEAGEAYNICSGKSWSMQEVLDMLRDKTTMPQGIGKYNDPARMRPSDVPILSAQPKKFRAQTGWEAEIPFSQTLNSLLEYWRERV